MTDTHTNMHMHICTVGADIIQREDLNLKQRFARPQWNTYQDHLNILSFFTCNQDQIECSEAPLGLLCTLQTWIFIELFTTLQKKNRILHKDFCTSEYIKKKKQKAEELSVAKLCMVTPRCLFLWRHQRTSLHSRESFEAC